MIIDKISEMIPPLTTLIGGTDFAVIIRKSLAIDVEKEISRRALIFQSLQLFRAKISTLYSVM